MQQSKSILVGSILPLSVHSTRRFTDYLQNSEKSGDNQLSEISSHANERVDLVYEDGGKFSIVPFRRRGEAIYSDQSPFFYLRHARPYLTLIPQQPPATTHPVSSPYSTRL